MATIDLQTFLPAATANPESWIWYGQQEVDFDFERYWRLKPERRGIFRMMGREIETPRWQVSFGRDYTFGGVKHQAEPIPAELEPFLSFASETIGREYNQAIINWYRDGNDYIGAHSDNEKPLSDDPIFSWTFYPSQHTIPRTFRILAKEKSRGRRRFDLTLNDKMLVIMGGLMQRDYTHEVIKLRKKDIATYSGEVPFAASDQRRINITLRRFSS